LEENTVLKQIKSFIRNESGATLIEYGLVAALIAVFAIVAMQQVGSNVNTKFANIATTLNSN
jgi:pilus assembly protein Flp/PilA